LSDSVVESNEHTITNDTTVTADVVETNTRVFNATQMQRKKVLEEDPLTTNVRHSSVTCKACGKVVKFNMFDIGLWNRHKGRCQGKLSHSPSVSAQSPKEMIAYDVALKSSPESLPTTNVDHVSSSEATISPSSTGARLTVAQAERKKLLEEDSLATDILPSSVTCTACRKVVKFGNNMFDLFHWNRHKARCKPALALSQSFSISTSSSQEGNGLTADVPQIPMTGGGLTAAQAQRKKLLEEDPMATNVLHSSATCTACGKLVKYTMFNINTWNGHKTRCKGPSSHPHSQPSAPTFASSSQEETLPTYDAAIQFFSEDFPTSDVRSQKAVSPPSTDDDPSSLTAAVEAQGKKVLEEDPLAMSVLSSSVTCKACGKLVECQMFSLQPWNEHKARCQGDPSRSQPLVAASSSKETTHDAAMLLLSLAPSKRITPAPP
jgi:hypothetical protein